MPVVITWSIAWGICGLTADGFGGGWSMCAVAICSSVLAGKGDSPVSASYSTHVSA
jgi:hypothetical protein